MTCFGEQGALSTPTATVFPAHPRQPLDGQGIGEKAEAGTEDHDVRDAPELAVFAERLGYQHGYLNRLMRRELGREYPGLQPGCYESHYVAGHLRGEGDVVRLGEYALGHGESRGPKAPLMVQHGRLL